MHSQPQASFAVDGSAVKRSAINRSAIEKPAIKGSATQMQTQSAQGKVFVPHSESLQQKTGVLGELVPFQLDYVCVRLLDGTYSFCAEAANP